MQCRDINISNNSTIFCEYFAVHNQLSLLLSYRIFYAKYLNLLAANDGSLKFQWIVLHRTDSRVYIARWNTPKISFIDWFVWGFRRANLFLHIYAKIKIRMLRLLEFSKEFQQFKCIMYYPDVHWGMSPVWLYWRILNCWTIIFPLKAGWF